MGFSRHIKVISSGIALLQGKFFLIQELALSLLDGSFVTPLALEQYVLIRNQGETNSYIEGTNPIPPTHSVTNLHSNCSLSLKKYSAKKFQIWQPFSLCLSSEDFSEFQNMAQNHNNRVFSPYAVDNVEDGSGGRELGTFKGSYQNPAYENCGDLSHEYEDPTRLLAVKTGPRRKRNELYEPTELKKTEEQEEEKVDYKEADYGGDSWLSRVILFLILIVSLASLLMVILIILGKVGPSCSCDKNSAQGKQLVLGLLLLKQLSSFVAVVVFRKVGVLQLVE